MYAALGRVVSWSTKEQGIAGTSTVAPTACGVHAGMEERDALRKTD